jgi:hypothetical protein
MKAFNVDIERDDNDVFISLKDCLLDFWGNSILYPE